MLRSNPSAVSPRSPFLVIGSGGHGRVVGELIRSLGHDLSGYVDADARKLGQKVDVYGSRVLMKQDALLAEIDAGSRTSGGPEVIALGVGNNAQRIRLLQKLSRIQLPALVHPTASVSPSATLGEGTVIFIAAVVNAGARLGRAVIINSGAIVEHDCALGDGVHVSSGAVLSGGVTVGDRSWIGAGAVVIEQIAIGADCIIGAGSVVVRDVPDGATVVGIPARPVVQRPEAHL